MRAGARAGWAVVGLLLSGCGRPANEARPLRVVALSPPSSYLVRRIGGARVEVVEAVPAGEDPARWRPSPAQISAFAEADLCVSSGAGFEPWLALAALPTSRVVDPTEGWPAILIDLPAHRHGDEPAHAHVGPAVGVWLDPRGYAAMAAAVERELALRDPEGAPAFAAAREALVADLAPVVARLGGTPPVPVAHAETPTFHHLARAVGVELRVSGAGEDGRRRAEDGGAADPAPVVWWEAPPSVEARAGWPAGADHRILDPVSQADAAGLYAPVPRLAANVEIALAPRRTDDPAR